MKKLLLLLIVPVLAGCSDPSSINEELRRFKVCRTENADKVLAFVKECTKSLGVEENSKVVKDCNRIALSTYCSDSYQNWTIIP